MVTRVSVVAEVKDRTEVRIRFEILRRAADVFKLDRVARDVERDGVNVPTIEQSDAGRALIRQVEQHIGGKFPLYAAVPVHDVRHSHGGVEIGGIAAAEIRTDEGSRAIGRNVETYRRRAVAKVKRNIGVAWLRLDDPGGEVFVEVLA